MCSIDRRRQRGFSLIEVLVAFAILCVSVTVILQSFSTALRGVSLAADYSHATLLAESLLTRIGSQPPVQAGEFSSDLSNVNGSDDHGYRWHVSLSPYQDPLLPTPGAAGATDTRLRLVVEVSWRRDGRQRHIRLTSLRYPPPPSRRNGRRG